MRKCVSALACGAALASIAVPASSAEYMEKSQQMAMRAYPSRLPLPFVSINDRLARTAAPRSRGYG
jgi:hypothetical protein